MAKPSEINDWEARRAGIVGLGERSFHKSYYPQLRQNVERLERFHTVLDQTTDFVILVALPDRHLPRAHRQRLQIRRERVPVLDAHAAAGQRVVGAALARGIDQAAQRGRAAIGFMQVHVATP